MTKIIVKKGSIFDLELKDSIVNLKRTKNETKVKSSLKTKGNFDFPKVKKIDCVGPLTLKDPMMIVATSYGNSCNIGVTYHSQSYLKKDLDELLQVFLDEFQRLLKIKKSSSD